MRQVDTEQSIRQIVRSHIEAFASGFATRHIGEVNNPNGTINMKIHNVFIEALGEEIQYYTSLVRSLDSSMGNMLEKMAINIAKLFFEVDKKVKGELFPEQISIIAEILENYKNSQNNIHPKLSDFNKIKNIKLNSKAKIKTHQTDYYLYDKVTDTHYLIELKIGGDLDNKKARSEKEAIFEQFAILSNTLPKNAKIKCYFATAYNRFGENVEWKQQRVLQFFSKDELLIGKDFWNFVCCSDRGYEIIIDEYRKSANIINQALSKIKKEYLG